jgi:spermidine/putrescine transport system permease protein
MTATSPPLRRTPAGARLSAAVLPVYTALVVAFLFAPIAVMIVFSFNDPAGRQNITWQGFTLENYLTVWSRPDITGPLVTSLTIAIISVVFATTFGTLIALALTRYEFRGRAPLNLLIFLPMSAPEIIMGAALLTLWVSIGTERGFWTIVVAHVMFNISYVVVTVRARLVGFNRSLEEAAMDLYANGWTTFWRVTFPIIFPGILAAALLAFALSIDDYVITLFNAGSTVTFPLWVFGVSRLGIPPEVNVLGTMVLIFALLFIAVQVWTARREVSAVARAREVAAIVRDRESSARTKPAA